MTNGEKFNDLTKVILTDEINLQFKEELNFAMDKIDEINKQIDKLIVERSMYEGVLSGINKSKEIYNKVIEKY